MSLFDALSVLRSIALELDEPFPDDGADISTALLIHYEAKLLKQISNLKAIANESKNSSVTLMKAEEEISHWESVDIGNERPPYDLDSPIVKFTLDTWTGDRSKVDYFMNWARSLTQPMSDEYSTGLQINSLSSVIKDAFIFQIFPLLKHSSIDQLVVYLRQRSHDKIGRFDTLRFDADDPFIENSDIVYDLRLRRIVPRGIISSDDPLATTDIDNYEEIGVTVAKRSMQFDRDLTEITFEGLVSEERQSLDRRLSQERRQLASYTSNSGSNSGDAISALQDTYVAKYIPTSVSNWLTSVTSSFAQPDPVTQIQQALDDSADGLSSGGLTSSSGRGQSYSESSHNTSRTVRSHLPNDASSMQRPPQQVPQQVSAVPSEASARKVSTISARLESLRRKQQNAATPSGPAVPTSIQMTENFGSVSVGATELDCL